MIPDYPYDPSDLAPDEPNPLGSDPGELADLGYYDEIGENENE